LSEIMGPTPPCSTASTVNASVGAIGTASIAQRATATVLYQGSANLSFEPQGRDETNLVPL
jgi:hypothetical protein